jgi:hypothetical protein
LGFESLRACFIIKVLWDGGVSVEKHFAILLPSFCHYLTGTNREKKIIAEIRLRFFKIAGRLQVIKTKVRLHLGEVPDEPRTSMSAAQTAAAQ